jgi:hypothetical protein
MYPIYFLPLHPFSIAINLGNRGQTDIRKPTVHTMATNLPSKKVRSYCSFSPSNDTCIKHMRSLDLDVALRYSFSIRFYPCSRHLMFFHHVFLLHRLLDSLYLCRGFLLLGSSAAENAASSNANVLVVPSFLPLSAGQI